MLDRVIVNVKAGDGGSGAVTFRREKFVPFGGPSGGDGGRGGSVFVRADESVSTLRAYQRRRSFKAEGGQHGMSKNKHGRDGGDTILRVPPGTLIYNHTEDGDQLLADLEKHGDSIVIARGGRGGWGNSHFATPTNQAPRVAQPGRPGEEATIVVELRLIADAGIVGYPNVGKSSLLASVSAAKPEIADYPFTTLEPVLGVVNVGGDCFVLAEIPGLIEGAHSGKGLGHEFLRHAMRTRVLVHLVDGTSPTPVEDMIKVNNELAAFDASLAKRPQVVAVNKIDLPEVQAHRAEIQEAFEAAHIDPIFISAAARTGLPQLTDRIWQLLKVARVREEIIPAAEAAPRVFRPKPVDAVKVRRQAGAFIVTDPGLERMLDKLDLNDPQQAREFNDALEKMGLHKLLKAAGAQPGDSVITGRQQWAWTGTEDENRRSRRNV